MAKGDTHETEDGRVFEETGEVRALREGEFGLVRGAIRAWTSVDRSARAYPIVREVAVVAIPVTAACAGEAEGAEEGHSDGE